MFFKTTICRKFYPKVAVTIGDFDFFIVNVKLVLKNLVDFLRFFSKITIFVFLMFIFIIQLLQNLESVPHSARAFCIIHLPIVI